MSNKKARLDLGMVALLSRTALLGTTIPQIMLDYNDAYECQRHLSQVEMRKWVYRRVRYMERIQLLAKTDRIDQPALYTITEAFMRMYPSTNTAQFLSGTTENNVDHLKALLHQYQAEMLGHTAECEEYRALIGAYPHLSTSIERMYQAAEKRSAGLVGQIRAINNILEQGQV